jgi:hypothetical protein
MQHLAAVSAVCRRPSAASGRPEGIKDVGSEHKAWLYPSQFVPIKYKVQGRGICFDFWQRKNDNPVMRAKDTGISHKTPNQHHH